MASPLPVGEVLTRIPRGPVQRNVLVATGTAWALAAMEVLLISFTLPTMTAVWGLSGTAAGVLGSASLGGMVLGSPLGGRLADSYGRLRTLQLMVAVYAVSAGLTALSGGLYSATLLRFLTGIGIGGTATATTVYLSEHLADGDRGRYLTYLDAFWAIGSIAAVLLAWMLLTPFAFSMPASGFEHWRLIFVVGATPILLVPLFGRFGDSPHYLADHGRETAARERLEAISTGNGAPLDLSAVRLVVRTADDDDAGFKQLLSPSLGRRTVVTSLAWFGTNFGFFGVFIWLPGAIGAAEFVGGTYQYLLLASVVQIPGYLSAAWLVDRVGAKRTLGGYLLLSGLGTYVFAAALPGVGFTPLSGFWPFLFGLLAASFFSVGAFGSLRAYTPAQFPTSLRSTGSGVAEGTGRIAGILGPIVAGSLVGSGYLLALAPLAVGFALAGVLVFVFGSDADEFVSA